MVEAALTGSLLVDLDDSGAFATDITAYWKRENGFSLRGRGRNKEHDAAGMASFVASLDNSTGRFSPKNAGSPYYPNWTAYKQAKVTLTFNSVTYDIIKGLITDIKVGPEAGAQLCEITIRDFMFLLSRTDIRRPLMRDQFTGVIIHRLLDDVEGAEGREKVPNPRFETDLTGYTVEGTATLTRMTGDEKILEGPAACRVVTSAANSGLIWTSLDDLSLQNIRVVAYVKPERDADIGANIQVQMHDDSGAIANSGNVPMATRDKWTRITAAGTFLSTGANVRVIAPTSGTQFRVGAVGAVPTVNAWLRTKIDDGQSQLKQFSHHRGPALPAIQEVRENELGGLFYFDGAGLPCFEDRHHRWKSDHLTAQSTFDERGNLDYSESGDDRVKAVILDYPHYVDGVAGTVVANIDRTVQLPPLTETAVELDYGGGLVRDTITPLPTTDYTVNASGDGSGASMLGSVTLRFIDFGAGSVGYFTNASTKIVYLRTYQVRGTPVKLAEDKTPARYTASGGPALAATISHDYQLNGSEPAIQAWAEYLGDRYSTQRYKLAVRHSAAFPKADITGSDIVPILARQVSDRVRHTNDNLPFSLKLTNADHYIDGIEHLRCDGDSIEAKWRLVEVDADYWVLEEAGSSLDTNTVLAA